MVRILPLILMKKLNPTETVEITKRKTGSSLIFVRDFCRRRESQVL